MQMLQYQDWTLIHLISRSARTGNLSTAITAGAGQQRTEKGLADGLVAWSAEQEETAVDGGEVKVVVMEGWSRRRTTEVEESKKRNWIFSMGLIGCASCCCHF